MPVTNQNSNWWTQYCSDEDFFVEHSGKLILLLSILDEWSQCGDKLLVFSQSLCNLDLIEKFLAMITENTKNLLAHLGGFKGKWIRDINYFRLDGNTDVQKRQIDCEKFNDNPNVQARLDIQL